MFLYTAYSMDDLIEYSLIIIIIIILEILIIPIRFFFLHAQQREPIST